MIVTMTSHRRLVSRHEIRAIEDPRYGVLVTESSRPAMRDLSYDAALRLSEKLVVAAHPDNTPGHWSWEGTAMRELVALAHYAVALRDRTGVAAVPLGRVVVPLFGRDAFERLVCDELTAAGHQLDHADPRDPVSIRWAWLHRSWDPDAPIGQRWDGLPRGIARGLPDPAIVVCLRWAAGVVDRALAVERGALDRRSRVRVIGGACSGQTGTVETPAWLITRDGSAVSPGPPGAYLVRLDRPDGVGPVEQILVTDLEPALEHGP